PRVEFDFSPGQGASAAPISVATSAQRGRRGDPARAKSESTRRARELWATWRRCSLVTGHNGPAPRSRLAIRPKTLSRGAHGFFNSLLGKDNPVRVAIRLGSFLGLAHDYASRSH